MASNKINLQKLKNTDLVRFINGACGRPVVSIRNVERIRNDAGYVIGTDSISITRLVGWLLWRLKERPAADADAVLDRKPKLTGYELKKATEAQRNRDAAAKAQDIGPLPIVANPERKKAALKSFRVFCETYLPKVFSKTWSPDHLDVIEAMQRTILRYEKLAMAMPRGSGKTSLCLAGVLYAALTGKHEFICIVASNGERAVSLLETIKVWCETNDLLLEDFPEVMYPIRKLERITQRQKGQKYLGVPTRIVWDTGDIVMPTIEGSPCSGVRITSAGLKGSDIRGQNHATADGRVVRPSLFLIDDPQTYETARSVKQCTDRVNVLQADLLGMAGPGEPLAAFMACTVIVPNDMADQILDRNTHPDWHGKKKKLVYKFPVETKLWDEYKEIRSDELKNDGDGSLARRFYELNREEMDRGAVVAWPERFNPSELSAIQHAMNIRFDRGDIAFFSEYQNEPLTDDLGSEATLTAEEIANKLNNIPRGTVPEQSTTLTCFIDVQKNGLFWLVSAWEKNFSGVVVDYGTYPEQPIPYFSARDLPVKLSDATGKESLPEQLYAGFDALVSFLAEKEWPRTDGHTQRIEKILIDANWGDSTDVVYQYCQRSKAANILLPSHGVFYSAASRPISEEAKKPGDKIGVHWKITRGAKGRLHIVIDSNYWKSFVVDRLAISLGGTGGLTLFGSSAETHALLSDHLTAEYPVTVMAKNSRVVREWHLYPQSPDNHWLDCLAGSAVAASVCGSTLEVLENKSKIEYMDIEQMWKNAMENGFQ